MQKSQSVLRPNRRSLAQHPHYFGAFLNLARHNAFMVMKHLSAKYDTDDKDRLDEASLSQAKLFSFLQNDLNKPDVTHAVLRDLRRYFPFLNYPFFLHEQVRQKELAKDKDKRSVPPFSEVEPEKVRDELRGMFTLLNKLRNNHSHSLTSNLQILSIAPNLTKTRGSVPKRNTRKAFLLYLSPLISSSSIRK